MSKGNDFINSRADLEKRVGSLLCAYLSVHQPSDIMPWCEKFKAHIMDKIKGSEVEFVKMKFEPDGGQLHCHIEVQMDCGSVEMHHRYTFTQQLGDAENGEEEEGQSEES
ncbi:hypothetical protein GR7B_00222 [Vibrio phage vB_VcorM_GR7B]|nr:hypothetical protein GR7B_00222 [Vibrio phage vB_VcorM_GR7B]